MYEVTIKKSFSAAHTLKEIGGKCEELHGHNFVVEVSVTVPDLNREGLESLSPDAFIGDAKEKTPPVASLSTNFRWQPLSILQEY